MSNTAKGPRKDHEKSDLESVQEWCRWARENFKNEYEQESIRAIESVCSQVNGYKKRLAEKDAEIARLREALLRAKNEYWNRCNAGSGEVVALTVVEFDSFINEALSQPKEKK